MQYVLNTLDNDTLQQLEIKLADVADKSEAEVIAGIRKQYKKLALKYHPDKNPKGAAHFEVLKKAYAALITECDEDTLEFNAYFTQERIEVSSKAFNLVMEEDVERVYQELTREFSTIKNEADKKRFAEHYADFFNLAQNLERNKEAIQKSRIDALSQQELDHSMQRLYLNAIIEWRKQILTLFGEEGLDDFQYREALASGDLWPILHTTKLMLPTKWLVAIINSMMLFSSKTLNALPYLFWGDTVSPNQLMMFQVAIVFLLFTLLPMPVVIFLLGAPVIEKVLLALACPYNRIIRPLHARFPDVSNTFIIGGVALAVVASVFVGGALMTLPSEILVALVQIGLQLWSIYQNRTFLQALHALPGKVDSFISNIMMFNSIMSFIVVAVTLPSLFSGIYALMLHLPQPATTFLWETQVLTFVQNCVMYQLTDNLENIASFVGNITEQLPLPDEATPEKVKTACAVGNTRATQSHYFFGTPKDAGPKHVKPREPFVQAEEESEEGKSTLLLC